MITRPELARVIRFDPETGHFHYLVDVSARLRAGARAGYKCGKYREIEIDGVRYPEHRLAVLYMTGEYPVIDVDHRDCDGHNNKWDNLRTGTRSQNLANRKRQKNNKCGFKGVVEDKRCGRFAAYIRFNRKTIYLGRADTPELAAKLYESAARHYFGEFARAA